MGKGKIVYTSNYQFHRWTWTVDLTPSRFPIGYGEMVDPVHILGYQDDNLIYDLEIPLAVLKNCLFQLEDQAFNKDR